MKLLLPLVFIIFISLLCSVLGQEDAAVIADLCNTWKSPTFDKWPSDCDVTKDICNWAGVICNEMGRVIQLCAAHPFIPRTFCDCFLANFHET